MINRLARNKSLCGRKKTYQDIMLVKIHYAKYRLCIMWQLCMYAKKVAN